MKTQPRLASKAAAAALALSACGTVTGISGGAPVAHANEVSARHAVYTRFVDLRWLAQAKRDAAWAAVQRPPPPAASPDSGLAACTALSDGQPAAASGYPKIAVQFAGSRWPDLRLSGLAYVEIATQLLGMHAYGGETVWFYQRLSAACAKHGRPLAF